MVELMHGDCLELMSKIPDASVDMVFCDLPYGCTHNDWDVKIDLDALWGGYHRVCKKNAAIILTAVQPFTTDLVNSNRKEFRYSLVWDKKAPVGFLNAHRMPLRVHEDILVFYQKLPVYHPQMRTGKMREKGTKYTSDGTRNYGKFHATKNTNDQYFPTSIIEISNANRGGKTHPTQKPVDLMRYLIRTYSDPDSVILDNCMGSGSTGVAAVLEGRSFIGIEMSDEYFDAASRWIDETCAGVVQSAET